MNEATGTSPRPTLVVSGVGMKEGGILTVLRNFVAAAEVVLPQEWRIVVLAHRRDLLTCTRAEVREYPGIKASWFKRMWFELHTSARLARELSATVWFAMHDITPLVPVERQYVYCHNPTCFSRPSLRAAYFDRIFLAHSLLYGRLYSLNIRRNTQVFVQQAWIREEFMRRFGAQRVTVSRPSASEDRRAAATRPAGPVRRWIYPTFPRHFKNVEVIGEAVAILERQGWDGEVAVTIGGDENRYARWLLERFGGLKSLKFVGLQDAAGMQALYGGAEGLLFPSKLETWGLPITEAQSHGLPLLVADQRYAHETVGTYDGVTFFDPDDAARLAELLRGLSTGAATLGRAQAPANVGVPTITGWDALVRVVCL